MFLYDDYAQPLSVRTIQDIVGKYTESRNNFAIYTTWGNNYLNSFTHIL